MDKPIYGINGFGGNKIVIRQEDLPACPENALTAAKLTAYVNRVTTLLSTLLETRTDLDLTINRLNVIRQEMSIVTGKPFTPLPPPPERGVTKEDGKINLSTNIV